MASSLGTQQVSASDDIAELERKVLLMQGDRKAYVEASKQSMRQNEEHMLAVRKENKELRDALAKIKSESGIFSSEQSFSDREITRLEERSGKLRKQLDEMSFVNNAKQGRLDSMLDVLGGFRKEEGDPLDPASNAARKIRSLENRLDKILVKHNEAHLIRKTYERIVKRLEDERVGFNSQLSAIERTLAAKSNDYEELLQLNHDALHARQLASAELLNFRHYMDEERRLYEKQLKERQLMLSSRLELVQEMERREIKRQEIEADARGEVTEAKERDLKARAVTGVIEKSVNEHKSQEVHDRIVSFEQAFRKIREATGVNDVNEVTQRFMNQETTTSNLEAMLREVQDKIELKNKEKTALKKRLEELRFSASGTIGSRRMIDEFEAQLQAAEQQCERNREKYDRISRLLLNVKSGIEHLIEIVSMMSSGSMDVRTVVVTNDNVVQALSQCESQLVKVLSSVGGGGGRHHDRSTAMRASSLHSMSGANMLSMTTTSSAGEDLSDSAKDLHGGAGDSSMRFMMSSLSPNNLRISLRNPDAPLDGGDDDDLDDGNAEVLDRSDIKKLALEATDRQRRKKHKKGVKKLKGKATKEREE